MDENNNYVNGGDNEFFGSSPYTATGGSMASFIKNYNTDSEWDARKVMTAVVETVLLLSTLLLMALLIFADQQAWTVKATRFLTWMLVASVVSSNVLDYTVEGNNGVAVAGLTMGLGLFWGIGGDF